MVKLDPQRIKSCLRRIVLRAECFDLLCSQRWHDCHHSLAGRIMKEDENNMMHVSSSCHEWHVTAGTGAKGGGGGGGGAELDVDSECY